MYQYRATIVRVIDGDTVVADVDLGFHVTHRVTFRLLGIDCPEMNTAAGKAAKEFVVAWLIGDRTFVFDTHKTDKYGRYLAKINDENNRCLNDTLIIQGHAVGYRT